MDTTHIKKKIIVLVAVCTFIAVLVACFIVTSMHRANKSLKKFIEQLNAAKSIPYYSDIYQSLVNSNACCFYLHEKNGENLYESGILIKDSEAKKNFENAIANEKYENSVFPDLSNATNFSKKFSVDITKLKKQNDDVGFLAKIGLHLKSKNQFYSYLKLASGVIFTGDSNKIKQKICYINVEDNEKVSVIVLCVNSDKKIYKESKKKIVFEGCKTLSACDANDFVTFVFYTSCTFIPAPTTSHKPPSPKTSSHKPPSSKTSSSKQDESRELKTLGVTIREKARTVENQTGVLRDQVQAVEKARVAQEKEVEEQVEAIKKAVEGEQGVVEEQAGVLEGQKEIIKEAGVVKEQGETVGEAVRGQEGMIGEQAAAVEKQAETIGEAVTRREAALQESSGEKDSSGDQLEKVVERAVGAIKEEVGENEAVERRKAIKEKAGAVAGSEKVLGEQNKKVGRQDVVMHEQAGALELEQTGTLGEQEEVRQVAVGEEGAILEQGREQVEAIKEQEKEVGQEEIKVSQPKIGIQIGIPDEQTVALIQQESKETIGEPAKTTAVAVEMQKSAVEESAKAKGEEGKEQASSAIGEKPETEEDRTGAMEEQTKEQASVIEEKAEAMGPQLGTVGVQRAEQA